MPTEAVTNSAVMLALSIVTTSPLSTRSPPAILAEVTVASVVPSYALLAATTEAVTGLGAAVNVHWAETGR